MAEGYHGTGKRERERERERERAREWVWARDFVGWWCGSGGGEGRGLRDAREMSERESEQLTSGRYIGAHLEIRVYTYVYRRKGEYIGTRSVRRDGHEQRGKGEWQEGIGRGMERGEGSMRGGGK